MYNTILRHIRESKTIIIHRHYRPDGDALGSQLALKEAIKSTFPNKKVYAVGDMAPRYAFMGEMDEVSDEEFKGALIFVLDSSDLTIVSDNRYTLGKTIIKIDHHISKEEYGSIQLVDASYESCAGLVYTLIERIHLKLNEYSAKMLFTGIVTDSGRFRYDSTTSRTFDIASKLMKYNFDTNEIYNNLYLDTIDMVKLRAQFTLKFKLTEENVAYIITTQEEMKDYGVDLFSISRNMVNTMAGIKGIDIWANFTEDSDGSVVCEFRSSKYNINPIAEKYGGGGHKAASGCTLSSLSVVDEVLEEFNKLAREKNEWTLLK